MSLIEMVLDQPLVLASLGIAILPLLIAVFVIMISRLKANATRRSRLKQARAAARRAKQTAEIPTTSSAMLAAGQTAQPAVNTPANSSLSGTAVKPVVAPDTSSTEEQPASEETNQPSSAMQDILSSVFADEDDAGHYEALLANLDAEIDLSNLVTMGQQIAQQIRREQDAGG